MKGNPRLEIFLFILLGLLLIYPLRVLTGGAVEIPQVDEALPASETKQLSAWADFRFSSAPEQISVYQGEEELWRGGGDLREDGDLELTLTHNRAQLRLEVIWPDGVETAYVECVLEVEGFTDLRKGFWSEGRDEKLWTLQWENLP